MLVDIDVPVGSQIIHLTRPDGSSTLSIPQEIFEMAATQYKTNLSQMHRGLGGFKDVAHVREFAKAVMEQTT